MQENTFFHGLSSHTVMDMFAIITAGEDKIHPTLPLNHCSEPLFYVVGTSGENSYSRGAGPCRPIDPALEPTWECIREGGSLGGHHGCGTHNLAIDVVFCECAFYRNPAIPIRVYYNHDKQRNPGKTTCNKCANGHGDKPLCPFCGEAH